MKWFRRLAIGVAVFVVVGYSACWSQWLCCSATCNTTAVGGFLR